MNQRSLHFHAPRSRRGFSIIELLVAIILIGILVTILIPVIANRAEDARVARAYTDIENLTNAQERLLVDTGYVARLFLLNSVPGGDGVPFTPENARDIVVDGIRDYLAGGGYFQNLPRVFLDPQTADLLDESRSVEVRRIIFERGETVFGWRGPYINWPQDRNYPGNLPDGLPDDPWGNNYLLFTRRGLIEEPQGTLNETHQRFDRFTILSLGPNGVPGDGTPGSTYGQGDDIYRKFGY